MIFLYINKFNINKKYIRKHYIKNTYYIYINTFEILLKIINNINIYLLIYKNNR